MKIAFASESEFRKRALKMPGLPLEVCPSRIAGPFLVVIPGERKGVRQSEQVMVNEMILHVGYQSIDAPLGRISHFDNY